MSVGDRLAIRVCATQTYETSKGGTLHVRFADNIAKIMVDGVQIGEVSSLIGGGVEVIYEGRHYTIKPLDLWLAVEEAALRGAQPQSVDAVDPHAQGRESRPRAKEKI